jgi:SlyX protein
MNTEIFNTADNDPSISTERLNKIEIKLAYLEDYVQQLQQTVLEQNALIDKLQGESTSVKKKLTEILDSQDGEMPHIRPPHY